MATLPELSPGTEPNPNPILDPRYAQCMTVFEDQPRLITCARFVDEQSGESSEELDISGFDHENWPRPGSKPGTKCTGKLTIPDTITPGALLVSYSGNAPEAKKPDSNRVRSWQPSPDLLAF